MYKLEFEELKVRRYRWIPWITCWIPWITHTMYRSRVLDTVNDTGMYSAADTMPELIKLIVRDINVLRYNEEIARHNDGDQLPEWVETMHVEGLTAGYSTTRRHQ